MAEDEDAATEWGWEFHRQQQTAAWSSATPARRLEWLDEILDWLRAIHLVPQKPND